MSAVEGHPDGDQGQAGEAVEEWRVWFKGSDAPTGPVDESTARRYLGLTADRLERRKVGPWETVEVRS